MMLLQSDVVQIGSAAVSLTTLALVLRLTFSAGELVKQVDVNTRRIDHLEAIRCPHVECPLRIKFGILENDPEGKS